MLKHALGYVQPIIVHQVAKYGTNSTFQHYRPNPQLTV